MTHLLSDNINQNIPLAIIHTIMTTLEKAILAEILLQQGIEDYALTEEERNFLLATLTDKVTGSIRKFLLGGREHNPDSDSSQSFLHCVDHLQESLKEVTDLDMYIAAAIYKAKRQS